MRMLNEPVYWWGPAGREPARPRSILDLIAANTLTPEAAADIWARLEAGASIIVAAMPPLAGKTTLLTALLAFLPPDAAVYFTRGWGERFSLPPLQEYPYIYLLINEISDHLPVYTWGPYARKAFELVAQGYRLAATMHAESPEDTARTLVEEAGIPPEHVGAIDLCLTIQVERRGGFLHRHLQEVAALAFEPRTGLAVRPLWRWDGERLRPTGETTAPSPDRERRARYLQRLLDQHVAPDAVTNAIRSFTL